SVFTKIVVNDQRVLTVVAEILSHAGSGIRRKILQWRRIRGASRNNNSLFHHAFTLEALYQTSNLTHLLTDGNVDVDNAGVLLVLVDHRVDCDGGFTSLAVADDKFALATANRDHRIDGNNSGHHWFVNVLALQHTRSDFFGR